MPKYAATYAPGYGALLYGDADGGVGGIFKRREDKAVVRPRFDDDAPVDSNADDPAAIETWSMGGEDSQAKCGSRKMAKIKNDAPRQQRSSRA